MIGGKLTYSNDNFVASNRQLYSVLEANLMNRLNIKPVGLFGVIKQIATVFEFSFFR